MSIQYLVFLCHCFAIHAKGQHKGNKMINNSTQFMFSVHYLSVLRCLYQKVHFPSVLSLYPAVLPIPVRMFLHPDKCNCYQILRGKCKSTL